MTQDIIWDHFQNEAVESFDQAAPRLEFLVRRLKPRERVLDIGVGSGFLERLAARKGIEIWALDPNVRSIEKLREFIGERAQVGRSEAAPFRDGQFDTVIMSEVFEHLEETVRERTLVEIHRILRPGGRLIGTVPAREDLKQAEVVCPECQHIFHRWGHQASFDASSMHQFLARLFRVETIEERFFNDWESAGWKRRLTGLLKKFLSWKGLGTYGRGPARRIYFVARK